MTFNVQLLPVIAGVTAGTVSIPAAVIGLLPGTVADSEAQAKRVADDLLDLPPDERPDVIALNEVFSEDGRQVLLDELSGVWPHVIESIHQGDLEEDSGLMVFSRLPFLPLPGGGIHRERFYADDAGADSWASKAAVLVQVGVPAEETTLVFTHLQAAYDTEEQYRDIRKSQLAEIRDLVAEVLGPHPGSWQNVIVAGDLNIRGDADATSDEWFDVFDNPGDPFGELFADGWIEMRPPAASADLDPGFTNRNRETHAEQRLDYICRFKTIDGVDLVAHHMRVGHRRTSDHYALEAIIQRRDDHCQPTSAVDLDAVGSIAGTSGPGQPSTSLASVVMPKITVEGGRSWVWVPRPGTYTFHHSPSLLVDVFAATDVSRPLTRLDQLSSSDVPAAVRVAYDEFERVIDPDGSTFVNREPMLVSMRTKSGQPGDGVLIVLEHLGDSRATAIALPPHLDVVAPFPKGQRLGDDDTAWFRVDPVRTLMATQREERVTVTLPSGSAEIEVQDAAGSSLGADSGTGPLEYVFTASADDEIYVTLRRHDDSDTGQVVRWSTPVTYLQLDRGVHVHVADETGPDWPGADEPELDLYVDGEHLLKAVWDDADTGEDLPGLAERIRAEAVQRGWTGRSIPFCTSLDLEIIEPDDVSAAHGVQSWPISALRPNEPSERRRTLAISVFDTISNGTYTVSCVVSRDP
ncbi:endonuclease/exonuclease/phosphatase family protein [Agromyces sp. C10]|uniref:endonuclease/exonuclease/phosphatase family protein n=1 Tax=Agromyces sp. C10 TaxID=2935077 RepID=UPI00200AECDA|nr:endonuclease/exonuclease/phosphatase family protein [Agromyces sp. C10]MCK8609304.1 endonuclease/exonuclease/phosphatase family protein [Agromyces sp. C10]